jgi:hypothetical protein
LATSERLRESASASSRRQQLAAAAVVAVKMRGRAIVTPDATSQGLTNGRGDLGAAGGRGPKDRRFG